MSARVVAIQLKIPDNTAFTALVALRRLGLAVESVERSRILRFDDGGDPAALADRVRANEAIFNPNIHRLVLLESASPRPGEVWIERTNGASHRCVGWRLEGAPGEPASRETLAAAVDALLCNPAIEKAVF